MSTVTEQAIDAARQHLTNGDAKGALAQFEAARNAAKKTDDVDGLTSLIAAAKELGAEFTGRQAAAYRRFLQAAEQNRVFASRKAALRRPAPSGDTPQRELAGRGPATVDAEPPSDTSEEADARLRPDIADATARMRTRFGGRRELKKLDEYLWHDETVSRIATGSLGGKHGLLVFTDRRLIFLFHGLMSQQNEDFPLDSVTSISVKAGLANATITVYSGGAKHEISNVWKDDAKAITDEIRNHIATRGREQRPAGPSTGAPPDAVAPQPQPDVLVQLKQLGELRDAGVLTNEEFEAKKAELLTRL